VHPSDDGRVFPQLDIKRFNCTLAWQLRPCQGDQMGQYFAISGDILCWKILTNYIGGNFSFGYVFLS
jgi:hypothetical protein